MEGVPRTDELLLFSLGLLSERFEGTERGPSLDELTEALGTTRLSLGQYLSKLRKKGAIAKVDGAHVLTQLGWAEYNGLKTAVGSLELIPERHGISRRCELRYLEGLIKDPYLVIRIASSICRNRTIDVPELMQVSLVMAPGSKERMILTEMLSGSEADRSSVQGVLEDLLLVGKSPVDLEISTRDGTGVDRLLILAELKRKRGEIEEAKAILNALLSRREGLSTDQWMVCILTWVQIVRVSEGPRTALEMVDRTLPRISKPIHVGLLRKVQGDILSDMKDHEGSLTLYRSALGIFRAERTRMLELSTLNNMGVTQFRQDRFDAAMRTWQKVRNLCIERDYVMMKALVGLNLADSYARIGKVKRAHAILRESAQVFEAIGDLESLSMVEFNRALVYVEEGKMDRALGHFSICERFPFVSELKAGERRDVLRARFAAKGWSCPV